MGNPARCILICVLIIISGLFSATETAFSYCNKIRIRQLSEAGNKRARRAEKVLDRYDDAIVAILIGSNVGHTLIASMSALLFIDLLGDIGSMVSTITITLIVFIFAETVPKNIAKVNCDSYTMACAGIFRLYMTLIFPITFLFTSLTGFLKKKLAKNDTSALTDDDFVDIVDSGEEEGILEPEESEIIRSAVEFSDLTVESVYKPIEDAVTVTLPIDPDRLQQELLDAHYSRVPVRKANSENFAGFIRSREYLLATLRNGSESVDFKKFLSPCVYVTTGTLLSTAFEEMCHKKCHMVFVRSAEDKRVLGILTLEDVLEELVGDIYDESDQVLGDGEEVKV
ncbi:MAG: DUF21 domain-containing protein [Clostridia bacterium]|nr:DUF21 domain-containing protein [Clostridia bacterium]